MRIDTKTTAKSRGRPKAYDRNKALKVATKVFRSYGYSATSLDMLSDATGMKRPSLYRAFGNKKAIYRAAMIHYRKRMMLRLGEKLFGGRTLRQDLLSFFEQLMNEYETGGCALICTSVSEAVVNEDIRYDLNKTLSKIDCHLIRRFNKASESGEITRDRVEVGAHAISNLMHSMAIRTRSGTEKSKLRKLFSDTVDMVLQ